MSDQAIVKPANGVLNTLGWAAYLACSWTWCIGMFLPVLLVRDYGPWGFVVFSVPNVIGAAAMGWVLTRRGSLAAVTAHRHACAAFSMVTIAFQITFFAIMLPGLGDVLAGQPPRRIFAIAVVIIAVVAAVAATAGFARRSAAVVVWFISAASLVAFLVHGGWLTLPQTPERPETDLAFLAPVCAFGFLLCPYLDLTFHRARQAADRAGPAAFSFGFGALFLLMILGTLAYFGPALAWLQRRQPPELALAIPLGIHIISQLTVTVAYHADEFDAAYHRRRTMRLIGMFAGGSLIAAAVVVVRLDPFGVDLSAREVVYRVFMSFYGLVFPAYVWLCMIPARGRLGSAASPSRRSLAVLVSACLLAAPFYWMGFIERQAVWLAPGLGIVLLARLLVRCSNPATCPATWGGAGGGGVNARLSRAAESSPESSRQRRAVHRSVSPRSAPRCDR